MKLFIIIKNRKTIKEFYSKNREYLFDLAGANEWDLFKNRIRFTKELMLDNNLNSIVDFGGGCGWSSLEFAKSGFDVTYVDYEGELMEFAKWLFKEEGVNVRVISLDAFFEEEEKYDVVYSNEVLEHIYDFGKALIKMTEASNKAIVVFYCYTNEGNLNQHINLSPDAIFYMYRMFQIHGFNSNHKLPDNIFVKKPYFGYKPYLCKDKSRVSN